jgi:hypothetical protein
MFLPIRINPKMNKRAWIFEDKTYCFWLSDFIDTLNNLEITTGAFLMTSN